MTTGNIRLQLRHKDAKVGIELRIPLGESVILATAQTCGALVWTQDAHPKGIQHVKYLEKA